MEGEKKTTAKKYEVKLSANALQNIDEITGYITFINREPLNAVKVGDELFNTISRIGQHPYAFKECDEIKTKTKIYRRAVCLSWLIIYKIIKTEIIILGIIHTSRKPSTIKILKRIK